MPPITPWEDFVASPDIEGMLLQIPIVKDREFVWGSIRRMSYDGDKLVVDLDWVSRTDPRQEAPILTDRKVEPVTIYPNSEGPFYLSTVCFVVRDRLTSLDYYIHPKNWIPKYGRITRFDKRFIKNRRPYFS